MRWLGSIVTCFCAALARLHPTRSGWWLVSESTRRQRLTELVWAELDAELELCVCGQRGQRKAGAARRADHTIEQNVEQAGLLGGDQQVEIDQREAGDAVFSQATGALRPVVRVHVDLRGAARRFR